MKKLFPIIVMFIVFFGFYAFSVDTDKRNTAENKSACAGVESVLKTSAGGCGGGAEVVKTANVEKSGCGEANVVKTASVEKTGCCDANVVKTASVEKTGCSDASIVKTANIVEKAADCSDASGAEAVATKTEGACCSAKAETDIRVAENK